MAAPDFIFLDSPDGVEAVPTADGTVGVMFNNAGTYIRSRGPEESSPFVYDFSGGAYVEGWATFYYAMDDLTAPRNVCVFAGPTTDLLRLKIAITRTGSPYSLDLEYWDGAAWIKVGATIVIASDFPRFDFHWNIANAGGVFEVYVDGALAQSFSGDTLTTADTTISKFTGPASHGTFNSVCRMSYVIVDSVDTRGLELEIASSISQGFHFDPAGSESDLDDTTSVSITTLNDTSANFSTAAERVTLNYPAIDAAYAGYTVEEVIIGGYMMSKIEGDAFYMKPALRKASTDYNPAGNFRASSEYVHLTGARVPLDPDGGVAWTQAAVNGYEWGLYASITP